METDQETSVSDKTFILSWIVIWMQNLKSQAPWEEMILGLPAFDWNYISNTLLHSDVYPPIFSDWFIIRQIPHWYYSHGEQHLTNVYSFAVPWSKRMR